MNPEEAEQALAAWASVDRNELVRAAHVAGVSKNRIHTLTGISRTTIDRILKLSVIDWLRSEHRRELAEEIARRFELLARGPFPVAQITIGEAASFAREIVCPTCLTEDGDPSGMACTRSWHLAVAKG